tara:strand:+ start:116 stop:406 length:291 start_codon:yes stop_codon:yes gene_type:complete
MNFKLYFLYFLGVLSFNQTYIIKSYAELNANSIIKIFCIESVKSEMLKANHKYTENFGNEICNCYLKNINNNIEHEKSIIICKEDINKKSNSSIKE